jgi:hypothetical protein
VILQPGETRRVAVEVVLAPSTPAGVHPVVVRVRDADGVLADLTVDVEVQPGRRSRPVPLLAPTPAVAREPVPRVAPEPEQRRAPATRDRATMTVVPVVLLGLGAVLLVVAIAIGAVRFLQDDDGSPTDEPTSTTAVGADPVPETEPEGEAPDLGPTVAVTGTIDLAGADPATVTVTVTLAVEGEQVPVTSTVDVDGRYELELPSGIHRIVATAPGYRESPQTVVVEDEPVEAQRITLLPA